jgi:KDO II ethanolaminephosphotransferase
VTLPRLPNRTPITDASPIPGSPARSNPELRLSFIRGHVQRLQAHRRRWPCWLFPVVIALVPNLPVMARRVEALSALQGLALALTVVVTEAILMMSLVGVLLGVAALVGQNALRLLGLLLLPVGAVAAWFMGQHQVVIGVGTVLAVLSTDHDLSRELLDAPLLAWVVGAGLLPTWLWWRLAPPSWWRGPDRVVLLLRWLTWLVVSAVFLSCASALLSRVAAPARPDGAPRAASPAGIAAHAYLPTNWLGSVSLIDPATRHRYLAGVQLDDLVVVLVIGETTRHDRMGLFGHDRDTTPYLALEQGLAAFPGRSCDTSTRLSLACMFVRPTAVRPDPRGGADTVVERDVFSVLRQLGFRIELYALQGEAGFYGRIGVDEMKVREQVLAEPAHQGKPVHDLLLVDELRAALARHDERRRTAETTGAARQPLLIVLHTKGSHYHYAQRYPADQAPWQPDCSGPDEACDDAALLNAYDNSVRYVDTMLQAVRDSVRSRRAWVVYSADHGESIGGGMHFHATPKAVAPPEQFKVPLLFWASPGFLADPLLADSHQRLMERARQAPPDRHGHHELFATMLGCLGVHSPDGGIDPALDLCAGP